mgnify:CR=1 FL=1
MKQPILLILVLCMIVQIGWTQNNATTIAYIAQFKSIAMKEMKRTGVPASITLSQAILESNSGESNLAKNHNNHFGIKCKADWTGAKAYQDDDAKQECFRAYDAAEVSFKDHSNFLKNRPNYVDLFLLDPVDDTAWAYGLKKAGYATAADYPKKLLKVINDFELSQYNFPELGFFEDEDTPTQKIDTSKKIEARKTIEPIIVVDSVKMDSVKIASVKKVEDTLIPLKINLVDTIIKKDTTAITSTMTDITNAKDSINSKYIDTIQLSNIKGITSSDSINITAPTAINGIGALPTELAKDSAIRIDSTLPKKDTSTVVSEKPNTAIKFEYVKSL